MSQLVKSLHKRKASHLPGLLHGGGARSQRVPVPDSPLPYFAPYMGWIQRTAFTDRAGTGSARAAQQGDSEASHPVLSTKLDKKTRSDSFHPFSSPQAFFLSLSLSDTHTHTFKFHPVLQHWEFCRVLPLRVRQHSSHLCIYSSGPFPTKTHMGKGPGLGTSPADLGSGHRRTTPTCSGHCHPLLCSVPPLHLSTTSPCWQTGQILAASLLSAE